MNWQKGRRNVGQGGKKPTASTGAERYIWGTVTKQDLLGEPLNTPLQKEKTNAVPQGKELKIGQGSAGSIKDQDAVSSGLSRLFLPHLPTFQSQKWKV